MASETLYLLMNEKGACMPTMYPTREAAQRAADTFTKKWVPVPTEVPATPTPPTPTLAEARANVESWFDLVTPQTHKDVDALIAAAQREAAGRIWCGSCHKLVRNQLDDIHSCFDADAVYRERIAELEADVARLTKPTQPAFQCPKCAGYFFGSAQKDGVWEYHCHGKMGRDGRQEGCGWRGPERECFPDAAREAAP